MDQIVLENVRTSNFVHCGGKAFQEPFVEAGDYGTLLELVGQEVSLATVKVWGYRVKRLRLVGWA
jgi:hypothetical protein